MVELLLQAQLDAAAGRAAGVGIEIPVDKVFIDLDTAAGDYLILDPALEQCQIHTGALGTPFQPDLGVA